MADDIKVLDATDNDEFLDALIERLLESETDPDKIEKVLAERLPTALVKAGDTLLHELKSRAPEMLLEHLQIRSQFEERLRELWKDPLNLLEMLLVIALEAGETFNREYRPTAAQKQDFVFDVLMHLHARACQIGSEVLTLLRSGYADGAHARWRTLHEISSVAFFVKKHGNDVAERYLLHDSIESYKAALRYREYYHRLGYSPMSDSEFQQIKDRRDNLCNHFGRDFAEDYGWAVTALGKHKPNIADIEKDVELDHWRPFYKMASHSVHANPKAIRFQLGNGLRPSEKEILLAGPSIAGLADPGHSTAISLHQITVALLTTRPNTTRIMALNAMQKLVDEIGDSFLKVHNQIEGRDSSQ